MRNLKRKLDEITNNFTIFFVKGHFIQSFELVEGRHRNPSKLGLVAYFVVWLPVDLDGTVCRLVFIFQFRVVQIQRIIFGCNLASG